MIILSNPPAIIDFLDWNCHYTLVATKIVATKIPHNAGLVEKSSLIRYRTSAASRISSSTQYTLNRVMKGNDNLELGKLSANVLCIWVNESSVDNAFLIIMLMYRVACEALLFLPFNVFSSRMNYLCCKLSKSVENYLNRWAYWAVHA